MKKLILMTLTFVCMAQAVQAIRLYNKDSESHKVIIKCSSTTHTEIGSNSSRDIGNGPCTVTLKDTGASISASGSTDIIIEKGGKLAKQ